MSQDGKRVLHGMNIDDAYVVERQLAHGVDGVTELVSLDGTGPFVRKRIPLDRAHRMAWAALSECDSPQLPHVHAVYEMPDEYVVVYDYVPGVGTSLVEPQLIRSYGTSCLKIAVFGFDVLYERHPAADDAGDEFVVVLGIISQRRVR